MGLLEGLHWIKNENNKIKNVNNNKQSYNANYNKMMNSISKNDITNNYNNKNERIINKKNNFMKKYIDIKRDQDVNNNETFDLFDQFDQFEERLRESMDEDNLQ